MKNLKATINNPKSPSILEVVYHPPMQSWIKCNTNGASNGNPGMSSCGGIFINHEATCISYFAEPFGNSTSYLAELCGAMIAIKIASENNWRNLLLETYSSLVVNAFKSLAHLHWQVINRWFNVGILLRNMYSNSYL